LPPSSCASNLKVLLIDRIIKKINETRTRLKSNGTTFGNIMIEDPLNAGEYVDLNFISLN
jgi:hypothetical protein